MPACCGCCWTPLGVVTVTGPGLSPQPKSPEAPPPGPLLGAGSGMPTEAMAWCC